MIKMNKKAASMEGWTAVGVGLVVLLVCLGIVITEMNVMYSQNHDATFGMSSATTKAQFEAYQGTLQTGMQGEASTNAINGISVVSSWGVIKAGLSMCWDLVTGQWIYNAIMLMQLGGAGTILAWGLRLLFVFSIGFILLKILFKVKV
jgi:hypothetical protein